MINKHCPNGLCFELESIIYEHAINEEMEKQEYKKGHVSVGCCAHFITNDKMKMNSQNNE